MDIELLFKNNSYFLKYFEKEIIIPEKTLLSVGLSGNNLELNYILEISNLENTLSKLPPNRKIMILGINLENTTSEKFIPGLQKYQLNYTNFLNLGFPWYAIISDTTLYEENIVVSLPYQIKFQPESYLNVSNLPREIKDIQKMGEQLEKDILKIRLKEFQKKEVKILKKYGELEDRIQKFNYLYSELYLKLEQKIKKIEKLELEKTNDFQISVINEEIETKNNYLQNLNQNINKFQEKKEILNLSILQLEQKNSELESKYQFLQTENYKCRTKNLELNLNVKKLEERKNYLNTLNRENDKKLEETNYIVNLKKKELKSLKNQITYPSPKTKEVISQRNLAVFFHVFNFKLFEEIISYINQIPVPYDLYINMSYNDISEKKTPEHQKKIQMIKNSVKCSNLYITISDNKGLDIGGFMISYLKMLELKIRYHSIIKLHTKSNNSWRFAMIYALLGNHQIIHNNLLLIRKNKIGMFGNYNLPILHKTSKAIMPEIERLKSLFNFEHLDGKFIPGTIFWIKGCVLDKYWNPEILNTLYHSYQKNYCGLINGKKEGAPHAYERFFGAMVQEYGLQTCTFNATNF